MTAPAPRQPVQHETAFGYVAVEFTLNGCTTYMVTPQWPQEMFRVVVSGNGPECKLCSRPWHICRTCEHCVAVMKIHGEVVPPTTPVSQSVPSASRPGVVHQTSATSCTCEAKTYSRDTAYVCRHMLALRPYCTNCGVDKATADGVYCAPCRFVLAQFASQSDEATVAYLARRFPAPVVEVAPVACDWPSFVRCVACGQTYGFSDANPLYCQSCELTASVAA